LKNKKDNLFGPTKTAKNLQKRSSKDLPTSRTKNWRGGSLEIKNY